MQFFKWNWPRDTPHGRLIVPLQKITMKLKHLNSFSDWAEHMPMKLKVLVPNFDALSPCTLLFSVRLGGTRTEWGKESAIVHPQCHCSGWCCPYKVLHDVRDWTFFLFVTYDILLPKVTNQWGWLISRSRQNFPLLKRKKIEKLIFSFVNYDGRQVVFNKWRWWLVWGSSQ